MLLSRESVVQLEKERDAACEVEKKIAEDLQGKL